MNQPTTRRPRLRKYLRRLLYVLSALLAAWLIAVQAGCLAMRTPDREWPEKIQQRGQRLTPRFCDIPDPNGRMIHAISVSASDTLPLVVLVHGSPGSADAYLDFIADTTLTKTAQLVAIDRPGFGYTQHFGRPEASLAAQAAAVKTIASQLAPNRKVILVGHSLGGPVIARFAMDYPEQTAGLVLVAGSIDPDMEEHPMWQAAINPPPLKWLIPRSFWASNYEIKALEGELRKMLPRWGDIRCPVTVIHAKDDSLVPVENADFARRMLVNCPDLKVDILPAGDHFILWSRHEKIRDAIMKMIKG